MKAVILAGGAGTGLKQITGGKPKTLLKICGKAVISYVIESIINAGIKEVLIVSDRPNEFEDITLNYGKYVMFELRKQIGNEVLGALLTAKDVLSKSLLVYGDTLVPKEALELVLNTYYEYGKPVLLVVPEEDVTLYGAIKLNANGTISRFIEKPKECLPGHYAFGGIAIINDELLRLIEREGMIDRAINEYIEGGGKIIGAVWSGWWVDIGYPWDLLFATYYILRELKISRISSNAKIASTAIIEGPIIIEDGVEIDHYSVIKGPAYIGRDVAIGTHTLIRPYTSIEASSVIHSYAEVVWSLVGPKSTIGRASFLGYSVVGEGAVIEPNVTTKLLVKPDEAYIRTIKEYKKRREYHKIGAFISYGSRIKAYTVLEPGKYY